MHASDATPQQFIRRLSNVWELGHWATGCRLCNCVPESPSSRGDITEPLTGNTRINKDAPLACSLILLALHHPSELPHSGTGPRQPPRSEL